MDNAQIAVAVGGAALIALNLWYFFGKRPAARASAGGEGVQEIEILVKGGYSPSRIEVERNRPVRLRFRREETSSCSDQVILSDFGIAKDLPAYKTTSVEFTPRQTGEFGFTCGMNMLHGTLVVR